MMKMFENDNMDKFIAEQRTRLAQDRQTLDKNPTSAVSDYILEDGRTKKHVVQEDKSVIAPADISSKENMFKTKPPTPQLLKLGEAYKQHKEKLKEELRLEYRQALAEKQVRTTGVRGKMATRYDGQPSTNRNDDLGLSLPIRDHLSAKERLRLERSREYNQFKANKENEAKHKVPRRLKTLATPITDHAPMPPNVNESTHTAPPATNGRIEESYKELLDRKRQEERSYRHVEVPDDGIIHSERVARKRDDEDHFHPGRRVGFSKKRRPRYVEYYYDDEDEDEDETEEELIERLRARRRRKARLPSDDVDDDVLFHHIRHKEEPRPKERRRSTEGKAASDGGNLANDLRSRSAPPEQEFTGLPIGKVASANTVQRRKDQYKMDLTRQMEEDRQRKMREKRLDKQADASQAVENKPSDRSQPPRKKQKDERPPESDEDRKVFKKKKGDKKFRRLDSPDSDEDSGGKHWTSHPRYPPYYAPSMMSGYYPPPQVSYPSPYDEAYRYYGSQNPLNPAMPPASFIDPSQRSVPAGVSPLLAAAESKLTADTAKPPRLAADHHYQSRTARADANKSSLVSDETRDAQKKKEMMHAYQEELKIQMRTKEMKKQEQKWEQDQYDKKKEFEAANYNPWGKGGGGAPMKDTHGNLISDLRSMHIQNEDLERDPSKVLELAKQRQRAIQNTEEIFHTPRKQDTEVFENSPHFGRSNPFEEKLTMEQRTQKDTYKDELQKQIEEKRRYDAVMKEQLRKLEEKEEKRMEDDARKMQEEYENEQKKQRDKIVEQQRKNEEIQKALEESRKEEERKKKEEQRKREEEDRREKERELDEKLRSQGVSPRVRTQERGPASSLSVEVQHVAAHSVTTPKHVYSSPAHHEVAVQASQTARTSYNPSPAPTRAPAPQSRESKRISRELSALRKQLLNEQQRIEHQLRVTDTVEYPLSGYPQPRFNRKPEAVLDLTARQRPVHVRRPPTVDRPNSKALRDFSEFKNKQDDTTSLRMFRIQHPDTPEDTSALMQQQEDLIKSQMMKIETLKSNLDMPEQRRRHHIKPSQDFTLLPADSYTSLLETETTYIPVPEDEYPPGAPESREKKASARERRRNKRHEEGGSTYRATPDDYSAQSLNSLATLDIDRIANKNQTRLDHLKVLQGDDVSLTDPDDILDRFVNQQNSGELPETPDTFNLQSRRPRKGTSVSAPQQDRPPSVNTIDTEPWLRPGTGPPATAT